MAAGGWMAVPGPAASQGQAAGKPNSLGPTSPRVPGQQHAPPGCTEGPAAPRSKEQTKSVSFRPMGMQTFDIVQEAPSM